MGETKMKLLIVEDDIDINNMIRDLLKQNRYETLSAYSGTEAIMCLEKEKFDLVLLDLMLPGIDGKQVLMQMRNNRNIPVIVLTAKDEVASKIDLLKTGADDYITKPFNNEELLARIEAVLRRNHGEANKQDVLVLKDILLDRNNFQVKVQGKVIPLTKREYLILELLMQSPNKVFTKNNIFESVWNEDFLGEDNSINVHISNIRQKLAQVNPEEEYIKTVWGIGFKMNV